MKKHCVIGCLALALIACGEDTSAGEDPDVTDEGGLPEGVRFLHVHTAEPGRLDLLVRSRETQEEHRIDGVALYDSSDWTAIPAGIYTVLIFRSGTTEVIASLALENLNVQDGAAKTIVAGQTSMGEPRTTQLIDDIGESSAPGENQGRLRFVHLAQAPPIDLYNDADGARLVTNIQNGAFLAYQQFPSTRYDFTAYSEGLRTEVLATISQLPLPPANLSTVVLVGNADPDGDGDTNDSAAALIHVDDYTY